MCWGAGENKAGDDLDSYSTYWWNRMLCCGHMPRLCRTASRLVSMSFPPMSTVPDVGGNRPVRMDLPNTGVRGRKDGLWECFGMAVPHSRVSDDSHSDSCTGSQLNPNRYWLWGPTVSHTGFRNSRYIQPYCG